MSQANPPPDRDWNRERQFGAVLTNIMITQRLTSVDRLLIRLDRLRLTPEQIDAPIPSISEKQFIVAKVDATSQEERLARELFWYREELLSKIQASWAEVSRSNGIPRSH
jgi:hypothetical protein